MKTIEIRYDAAPLLSQTVGPFLTERTAMEWQHEFLRRAADLGWQHIPNQTTFMMQPGDGFIERLRHLETSQMMTVQMRAFDEPLSVDLFVNQILNVVGMLPTRR